MIVRKGACSNADAMLRVHRRKGETVLTAAAGKGLPFRLGLRSELLYGGDDPPRWRPVVALFAGEVVLAQDEAITFLTALSVVDA